MAMVLACSCVSVCVLYGKHRLHQSLSEKGIPLISVATATGVSLLIIVDGFVGAIAGDALKYSNEISPRGLTFSWKSLKWVCSVRMCVRLAS